MLAGVDGCKSGWIVAFSQSWPSLEPIQFEYCTDFTAVLRATSHCSVVAVDMPIGLPDSSDLRECDVQAHHALGSKGSSVFMTPPRACIDAKDVREFQSLHRQSRKKGAGLPVWGIVPKMRDVNRIMEERYCSDQNIQDRVIEFHPELTWCRLAGSEGLLSKHIAEGILQRIALLERDSHGWLPVFPKRLEGSPSIDDILDAVAGLSAAQSYLGRSERTHRYPLNGVVRNGVGLRMEIWY